MTTSNRIKHSDRIFEVINPYSREIVDTVPITSTEQIDDALNSSYKLQCNLDLVRHLILWLSCVIFSFS